MRRRSRIGRILWGCSCLACNCLNLALACVALGLTGLVLLNIFQKDVPLPDRFARWVLQRIGPDNIQADWSRAVFDLRGSLLLHDLTLTEISSGQVIATAGLTRLQWSPAHLLFRFLPPLGEADATNVHLYLPASHSPTGLNEPVLLVSHAVLREDQGQLVIEDLALQTGQIRLHLTGSAPLQQLLQGAPERTSGGLVQILQTLRRLPQDRTALITANWQMLSSRTHVFSVDGLVPDWQLPQATLQRLRVRALAKLSAGQWSLQNVTVQGVLADLRVPQSATVTNPLLAAAKLDAPIPFQLEANGTLRKIPELHFPSRLQLVLDCSRNSLPIKHLILSTTLGDPMQTVGWSAFGEGIFASGTAQPVSAKPSTLLPSLPVTLLFRASLTGPALADFLPAPPDEPALAGAGADYLRLEASYQPDPVSLQGWLEADGLRIAGTRFARIHTAFELNRSAVHLSGAQVQIDSDEFASGSYSQQFPSSRFSLNAAGAAIPATLDPILGTWWDRVTARIHSEQPLTADVTVWGTWTDIDGLESVTRAWGGPAQYRSVEVDRLDVRVRSNRNWVLLEQLRAETGGGTLSGTIGIRSGLPADEPWRAILLDVNSDAPWPALCEVSGVDGLQVMNFSAAPVVEARGTVWEDSGRGFAVDTLGRLDFQLNQESGLCKIESLELEGLRLQGQLLGSRVDIGPVTGRIAGGIFAGRMMLEDWRVPDTSRREYEFQLLDGEYAPTVRQLYGLMDDATTIKGSLLKGGEQGRLDLDVHLVTGAALADASGHASATLREADLGRIHLFGGLSRFLDGIGIGFSSMDLNAAALEGRLDNQIVHLERGSVTGPRLQVNLTGKVDLARSTLDMKADITLSRGLIGLVLSPVSENLQFDLSGSTDEPTWKVRLTPFRWFQNQTP